MNRGNQSPGCEEWGMGRNCMAPAGEHVSGGGVRVGLGYKRQEVRISQRTGTTVSRFVVKTH